jgi:hypothetical protein
MPKFVVHVKEVYTVPLIVEAENEQDAQGKAEELIACGCYADDSEFPEPAYDYTLQRSEWPVDPA